MKKKLITALVVVLALAALVVPGIALAQNTATDQAQGKEQLFQTFVEKLAANLGIDAGKLLDAIKQTGLQMVDEAVQQGKLNSDQAEKMKERIQQGRFIPFGPFGRPEGGPMGGKHLEDMAQILGMSADELKAELQQGKKIEDLAQEKGLTLEQLHQKMVELKIQEIQQAVKDGKISQDKADKMIQRLQNAPQGKGFGFGHFGPRGGQS
ncbi:MAG: hypothetical protein ACPLRH_05585, partial [Desulfotomaculales bacterium]